MAPKRGRPIGKQSTTASPQKTTPNKRAEKPPSPRINEIEDEDDDRSSDSDFDVEKVGSGESEASGLDDDDEENDAQSGEGSGKRKGFSVDSPSVKRTKVDDQESDVPPTISKGKKRKPGEKVRVTFADLDSGDEITINSGSRKSKRGANTGIIIDEDEEGGEGGWVKTRSQRRLESEDDRPLQTTEGATINVDEVWARLAALPIGRPPDDEPRAGPVEDEADYIMIKRTTHYAGEVTTEVKRVHKYSAEAKLYLEEQDKSKTDGDVAEAEHETKETESGEAHVKLRRPLKRRSRFEANPTGEVKALAPHLQLRWPRTKTAEMAIAERSRFTGPKGLPPPKISTVDKSRRDWAGYVDQAGIGEELDKYGKSKATYLGRQEFLNRAENIIENDRRVARQKLG